MKKITLLAVLIFCVSTNMAAQDCSAYHKGYFKYTDSSGALFLIQRKKKYQYEYNRAKKIRTQYWIQWIDDCTYTITQTLTNSKEAKKFKNSVTKITISVANGENGYYYTCACLDDTKKKENLFVTKITKEEFYKLLLI